MNKDLIVRTLKDAHLALEPFAENPNIIDLGGKEWLCHAGITDKWHCGRCSRAINAHGTLLSIDIVLSQLGE